MIDILNRTRFQRARRKVLQLGLAALAAGSLSACDTDFGNVISGGPIGSGDTVSVALLVPYGSSSQGDEGLARALENSARLAIADLGTDRIRLKVYNTAGQAGVAASAASQAVSEGADVIIGPLRSDAANAAAVAARGQGVNVLAFSNNSSIAGGNLFVLGNTFDNIASRVIRYAGGQGRNRVVVVYPQTGVGQIARDAVIRAASGTNVSIVGQSSFALSQAGIEGAVPGIVNTVNSSGANAVMLTSESVGALPVLARLLPEQGLNPTAVKSLGLTRWDVPPQTLSLRGLQGGWFALPDPVLTARFNSRYQSAYGSTPHPLGGLAYDGIAAVGALLAKNRDLSAGNLTQGSGFVGVNGVFRLKPNGTAERAMAIAQVTNNQVQIIDPAPKSFGFGGF